MSVDCSDVIRQLYELLDGELTSDRIRELEGHVGFCGDCLRRLRVEKEFKELLRQRCCDDKAPEQLRDVIRDRLRSELDQTS